MNCTNNPIKESEVTCPNWASSGCFVGDTVIRDTEYEGPNGNDLVKVTRGCSSFSEGLWGAMQMCSTLSVDYNGSENPSMLHKYFFNIKFELLSNYVSSNQIFRTF